MSRLDELAPRVYDNRIAPSDAARRFAKELRKGAVLAAVASKVQTQRSYYLRDEQLTDRDYYTVIETGLVEDGEIVAHARYRSDGRVKVTKGGGSGTLARYHFAPGFEACLDESKKPPVRSRFP